MDKFYYKELDKAKYIESNGFATKYEYSDICSLAKFYRLQDMKPKEIKEKLILFCSKYIKEFSYEVLQSSIESATLKSKNSKILHADSINIYQCELDYITSLDIHYNYKKFLFALLCMKKIEKEGWKNENISLSFSGTPNKSANLKQLSGTPKTKKWNMDNMIADLTELDLLGKGRKGKFYVNFISNINYVDGEVAFEIKKFETIPLYFDRYNNVGKIIECKECGKLVKAKSNRQTYCNFCFDEGRKEYYKVKKREYRENVHI